MPSGGDVGIGRVESADPLAGVNLDRRIVVHAVDDLVDDLEVRIAVQVIEAQGELASDTDAGNRIVGDMDDHLLGLDVDRVQLDPQNRLVTILDAVFFFKNRAEREFRFAGQIGERSSGLQKTKFELRHDVHHGLVVADKGRNHGFCLRVG